MRESTMRAFIFTAILICIVSIAAISALSDELGSWEKPIYMLLVPSTDAIELEARGEEIAQSLYDMTGLYIKASLQTDYAAMVEAFAFSEGDTFGIVTTEQYIRIYQLTNGNVTPRLSAVRNGYPYYFSKVYVRRDLDIESIEELNGKTWIYSDVGSTSGYVLPNMLFNRFEISIKSVVESGGHINSMIALLERQGDFCTGYGNAPLPPSGCDGFDWRPGDDPELWIWDRWNDDLYREELRGTCMDLRRGVRHIYDLDDVIRRVGVLEVIGPIPNDCLAFGPDFPIDVREQIVAVVKEQFRTEVGRLLWGEGFYGWTAVTEIDDSYYDEYRRLVGLPMLDAVPSLDE